MTISIIVPVYNVQDYIAECIESILSQDYQDYELIIVDDGSTDASGQICEELKDRDPRIRVYHKENGGLSDARNYGIDRARGEYITFIDSDDLVVQGYFSTLKNLVDSNSADVACVQAFVTGNRNEMPNNTDIRSGIVTGAEAVADCLLIKNFGVSACGKLFKAELFSSIRYPRGKLYEDLLTIPYIFEKCGTVAFSTAKLYLYYERSGSITHSKITEKNLALLDDMKKLICYLDIHCPMAHDAAVTRFCIDSVKKLSDILILSGDYSKYIRKIQHKCKTYWKEGLRNPLLAKSIKIQIAILGKSSILYWLLFGPYKIMKAKYKNTRIS